MTRLWLWLLSVLGVSMAVGVADGGLIFGPQKSGLQWFVINDGVMGGVSNSRVGVENGVMIFSGRVRLENNGGFASVRSELAQFDLSKFQTLRLRLRGEGKRFALQLGTRNARGLLYNFSFTAPKAFADVDIPLAALRPTRFGQELSLSRYPFRADMVEHIGFIIANKSAEEFRLEVESIRAF